MLTAIFRGINGNSGIVFEKTRLRIGDRHTDAAYQRILNTSTYPMPVQRKRAINFSDTLAGRAINNTPVLSEDASLNEAAVKIVPNT